jgi:dimethylargininase
VTSYQRAIVRPPGANFASGLTTAGLGAPVLETALEQHERYCEALEACGLMLTRLPADLEYPDSTFIEDTAVLTGGTAILTRPGAESRAGEVVAIGEALQPFCSVLRRIEPPGTLDGGDVCDAGDRCFIGISRRTNEAGARQLAELLAESGRTSDLVDIRGLSGILHLKSGIASLGENRLVAVEVLADREVFRTCEILRVPPGEEYAANCARVNDALLIAAGFPGLESKLRGLGYVTHALEMSEFQKMDGGLSCLSLRF